MTTLEEFLTMLAGANLLHIVKSDKTLYMGYMANLGHADTEINLQDIVERFKAVPEIKHKKWRELGLMQPLQPEQTLQYKFSDLQMNLYYTIILKDEKDAKAGELQKEIMELKMQNCNNCPDAGDAIECEQCSIYERIEDAMKEIEDLYK